MGEWNAFESIISPLHEAAFDPDGRPRAAASRKRFLDTHGSTVACGGGESEEGYRTCVRGERRPDLEHLRLEARYPLDERTPRLRRLPFDRSFHIAGLHTEGEKRTSESHNAFPTHVHAENGIDVRLYGLNGSRILWQVNDPLDGDSWSSGRARRAGRSGHKTARRAVFGVACLALVCLAPAASAQTGGAERLALTVDEAVRLALSKSRAAISARLGREEQKLSLEAAEERYDPMASLSLERNYARQRDPTAASSIGASLRVPTGGSFQLSFRKPLAGEGDREASTTLSFSQPLLRGFGTELDTQPVRQARLQERIDLRAFRDTAAGIVDSAVSAYRGVLRARQRLVIAREALERARRQLEINRALVEAGRMAPQDLVQTEADVADKEYALSDAENALETANSLLVNTLDLEEGVRIEPRDEPPAEKERPGLEESLETAFARRTDWLRAETGLAFARMGLRSAQNALLPDLSLSARAAQRGRQDPTDWSVGLNLTVPFQNDGARRELVRARNGLRRAQMNLAETRQSIRIEVRRAVRDVAVALRQIDLAAQARALAARKLDIERRKLQQGLSSAFHVGRFEDDLVNAQRRELDAAARYRDSLAGLDRTLGTTLDRWGISVERVGR